MKSGKIIVIVAPSGSGKSTLIKRLKNEYPEILEAVSFTTRGMREGEEDGIHYFFITKEEFKQKIANDEFLEWAEVHENFYGMSKKFVEQKLSEGKKLLFDLDVQGADTFKEYFKDNAIAIFIAPPSVEELEKRLINRGTESTEAISVRVNNAKEEVKKQDSYDYKVVNDELEMAYDHLSEIIQGILKEN